MSVPSALVREDTRDAGHSLVEALVALALLLGVAFPAGAALTMLTAEQSASDRIEAFRYATDALEDALDRAAFTDSTWTAADSRLSLQRQVYTQETLHSVTIEATPTGRPHRVVLLRATVRAALHAP